MHGYRVFLQISFEVVAVFAKHHQEDTGIPNHFALPGVHGHDSNKRHRICNGTLALGCGYCGGLYSSCSHGRHGRRQGYCTVPFEQNSAKLSKCVINSYGMALPSAIIAVQVVTITPFRWVLWKDEWCRIVTHCIGAWKFMSCAFSAELLVLHVFLITKCMLCSRQTRWLGTVVCLGSQAGSINRRLQLKVSLKATFSPLKQPHF